MFHLFEADTAEALWGKLHPALHNPHLREQTGRGGSTRELLHVGLCLNDPRQRWITARRPALNLAFALAEVIWILAGRQDAAFLTYFFSRLPKYMGEDPTFHGAYGHRLRYRFGLDQLERAYDTLGANPESRQVVLQIWDAMADLPTPDGGPTAKDIPCNVVSLLKVRDGRLEWTQVMRSNDLYRGLPHNLVQFTCLQEVMAGWLGLDIGPYHHLSDSLHYYLEAEPEFGSAEPVQTAVNSDSLACPRPESERYFAALSRHVERIIDPAVTLEALNAEFEDLELASGYRNIACVLQAEAARRRRATTEAARYMDRCTNPAYRVLQDRWLKRIGKLD